MKELKNLHLLKAEKVTVTETAGVQEILEKLVLNKLICVVDSEERVVGIIVRKHLEKILSCPNVIAADICNKNFIYTTLNTVESDSDKFWERDLIPLLDSENRLVTVLHRTPNYTEFKKAQAFEIDWWRKWVPTLSRHQIELSKEALRKRLTDNLIPDDLQELLIEKSKGHRCIEIGAGAFCGYAGLFTESSCYTIIEPLANEYQK